MNDKLLAEISVALGDIVALLEKADDQATASAILTGLRAIAAVRPEVTVTPQITLAPAINVQPANVTVQPADVVFMPAPVEPPRGWKLVVTGRDGNGSIHSVSFKPE